MGVDKTPISIYNQHMNTNIQDIANKAWEYVNANATWDWTNPNNPTAVLMFKEKFAELIVRECAAICVYAVDRQEVLAHFGVEE